MTRSPGDNVEMSADEFGALFSTLRSWGRWGDRDQRGAMNHLGPELVAAAAARVREGISISLSLRLDTEAAPDNPEPAVHRMTMYAGRFSFSAPSA